MTLFMNRLLALGLVVAAPAMLMAGGDSDSGTSSSGAAAMAAPGQFSEAPMLAAMVAAGELPPLEERIAVEPVVQEMLADGVGKYGGTLRVSDATGAMNRRGHEMTNQEVDIYLLKMHQETREILPNIAKGYDVSADGLTVTLELRPGTKWSNGDPFIVDDIMFVMEDLKWDDRVDPGRRPNETPPTATHITKIDDYTMQFHLSAKDHVIIPGWTTWKGGNYVQYAPSTFLKQWHIRYNADAQKLAEEEGFETWAEAVVAHWEIKVGVGLLETPTMFPWVPKEIGAQAEIWERNAYFWKVDPAGQQLPYIDRVLSTPNANREVFNLKAIAGEVDWAIAQTNFASLPDYKENEERGNYTITLIPGVDVGRAFGFNPTYNDEQYRALLLDVRFRRAMSVALDRDELNEVYFLGLGRPTAATIHSDARFYRPEWQYLWANYDPDLANQLLDEVGLDGRDRDGFRTFPDGSNLTIQVAARTGGSVDISKLFEIEIAQWGDVGLRVTPRLVDNAAWVRKHRRRRVHAAAGHHRRHHRVLELDQRRRRLRRRRPARRLQHGRQLRRLGNGAHGGRTRRAQAGGLRRRAARNRAARGVEALLRVAAAVRAFGVRLRRVGRAGAEDVRLDRRQCVRHRHRRRGARGPAHQPGPAQHPDRVPGLQHRLEGQPDVLGRPALVRPRIAFLAT